ncbi:hypothetical protein HNV27_36860, partial [Myxococcus xanthus]|nr:hypothetical protein [Myxococcus xanthus]
VGSDTGELARRGAAGGLEVAFFGAAAFFAFAFDAAGFFAFDGRFWDVLLAMDTP